MPFKMNRHLSLFGRDFKEARNDSPVCVWSIEPPHDKTNKIACAPSEDSDQPGHPPSMIRVFAARMKKAWVLSYPLSAQRRLWSDWADTQADLSLRLAHSHFFFFRHEAAQLCKCETKKVVNTWAGPWENVSYVICEQQRRRSACAPAQSNQRLCCSLRR